MKKYILVLAACAALTPFQAQAERPDHISIGVGAWDVQDSETAADFRLEYRSGYDLLGVDGLHTWTGLEVTSDASLWAGFGFLYDINVTDEFYITPNVGVGYYAQGSSNKELGYPIEFRSQLEAGYQFDDTSRVGVSLGHISNASLDDTNPGTEILNLYYHIPVDTIF